MIYTAFILLDVQFVFRTEDAISVIEGSSVDILVEVQLRTENQDLLDVEFPVLFRVFTTDGNASGKKLQT